MDGIGYAIARGLIIVGITIGVVGVVVGVLSVKGCEYAHKHLEVKFK
jgi:hypothetical protein